VELPTKYGLDPFGSPKSGQFQEKDLMGRSKKKKAVLVLADI
jgi:hypothetical protein